MARTADVERAYARCTALSALIRHVRDDALRRPMEPIWLRLGLVEDGDRKDEAVARMEELFDELQALIDHLFILDMAAQFERACLERVKNYIGSARSASADPMRRAKLPALASGVIKDAADFENITAFLNLLDGYIDKALMNRLKAVRHARNAFAHGIDVMAVPTVSREDVRDSLTEALAAM